MNNDWKIELQAIIDQTKSTLNINKDINNLQNKVDKLKIKAELDPIVLKELTSHLQSITNQKITLSNLNVDEVQITHAGQQIGGLISKSAERAISSSSSGRINKLFRIDKSTSNSFKAEMSNLVKEWTNAKGQLTGIKIDTKTVYDKDTQANIESLKQATVTYKNELDEVIKKTIAWRQTGATTDTNGEEKKLYGFVEAAGTYTKALEKASIASDIFADRQLKLKSSLNDTFTSLKSAVSDQNVSKPIKSQDSITELEKQYKIIESSINNVGSASKSNFAVMEADAKTQISILENMIRQYRNAETVATSLRTKDFGTVKSIEIQGINEFENKIKTSKVPISELENELSSLRATLSSAFDPNSLTSYLNEMDIAKAKFKSLKAEFSNKNNFEIAQIKADGLSSIINGLSSANVGLDKFEASINNTKVTVSSLLSELSQVKTTGDVSVVKTKWDTFTNAAKEAGIAVDNILHPLSEVDRKTFNNQLESWKRLNSNAKQFFKDIDLIEDKLFKIDDMGDLANLRKQFKEIDTAATSLGVKGFNYIDKFRNAASKFTEWLAPSMIIMEVIQQFKNGASTIAEFDDAMTDVSYTSDITAAGLENLGDNSIQMAKDLNTSATNILEAVKIYSTAKSTADDILRKAQPAIMLSNTSGMSGAESSKTINTALNQFEMEDTEAGLLDIVDTLEYVSSQLNYDFTAAIKEVNEGIEASGNVAHVAGLNMQEYAAMIGLAVEKTGQSGGTVGK